MNNYIVETNQLSKDFSGEVAVNQLSIHIRKNEIYGFLGPNGAGKSTAMKILKLSKNCLNYQKEILMKF